jgi:hypothetical protein
MRGTPVGDLSKRQGDPVVDSGAAGCGGQTGQPAQGGAATSFHLQQGSGAHRTGLEQSATQVLPTNEQQPITGLQAV